MHIHNSKKIREILLAGVMKRKTALSHTTAWMNHQSTTLIEEKPDANSHIVCEPVLVKYLEQVKFMGT